MIFTTEQLKDYASTPRLNYSAYTVQAMAQEILRLREQNEDLRVRLGIA